MYLRVGLTLILAFATLISAKFEPAPIDTLENVRTTGPPEKIVSGWEANPGQHPWQLSLRLVSAVGSVSGCGASIVHPDWAITAAHCTANRVTAVIRAGLTNLTRPDLIFETSRWYNHPDYIEETAGVQPSDITILHLGRTLEFNERIQPIRIQGSADMNYNYENHQLFASGYGLTMTGGSSPEILHWVYLKGVSNFDCWATFSFSSIIVDSTICASGYNETSQSTCSGDSGGPLSIIEKDGKATMIGVSSFVSATGCHTDFPAGFIRPGHYHDWYREVTGIDFDWEWEPIDCYAPQPRSI